MEKYSGLIYLCMAIWHGYMIIYLKRLPKNDIFWKKIHEYADSFRATPIQKKFKNIDFGLWELRQTVRLPKIVLFWIFEHTYRSISKCKMNPESLIIRSTSLGVMWNTICPLILKMKSESSRPASEAPEFGFTVLTLKNLIHIVLRYTYKIMYRPWSSTLRLTFWIDYFSKIVPLNLYLGNYRDY